MYTYTRQYKYNKKHRGNEILGCYEFFVSIRATSRAVVRFVVPPLLLLVPLCDLPLMMSSGANEILHHSVFSHTATLDLLINLVTEDQSTYLVGSDITGIPYRYISLWN